MSDNETNDLGPMRNVRGPLIDGAIRVLSLTEGFLKAKTAESQFNLFQAQREIADLKEKLRWKDEEMHEAIRRKDEHIASLQRRLAQGGPPPRQHPRRDEQQRAPQQQAEQTASAAPQQTAEPAPQPQAHQGQHREPRGDKKGGKNKNGGHRHRQGHDEHFEAPAQMNGIKGLEGLTLGDGNDNTPVPEAAEDKAAE